MEKHKFLFAGTKALQVLRHMAYNPFEEFTGSQLAGAMKKHMSKPAYYLAIKELMECGYVNKQMKGSTAVYTVNAGLPEVRQFKVLNNILDLEKFTDKLKELQARAVLFGSASRGEDVTDSDYDIAIAAPSEDHGDIKKLAAAFRGGRKISPVLFNSTGWSGLKDKDPVFFNEIDRGILLTEEKS